MATAPDLLLRVGRVGAPLRFSTISPFDAALPKAGNRFDVPGGGVLYAATTAVACYAETLARFRPTARMRELLKEDEPGFMVIGGVAQDWRLQRVLATIRLVDPLSFLDIEAPETHEFLSDVLASDLAALGYEQPLDLSAVTNQDRRLSRLIAAYAYAAALDEIQEDSMFDTIQGLPLHPLVVHATVVLVPLAALLLIAAAVSPAVRRRAGWLTPALAVVAFILVPITEQAGESLEHRVPRTALVEEHAELGEQMLPFVLGVAVVAIILAILTRRETPEQPRKGGVMIALMVLSVVVGIGAMVTVVRAGHSGATSVWSEVGAATPTESGDGDDD